MNRLKHLLRYVVCLSLFLCAPLSRAQETSPTLSGGGNQRFFSFDYSNFNVPIAGVAGGNSVVFVGEPLNGNVAVLSRFTGQQIGQLPPPPNGFVLPFIMHSLGEGHLAVLDAGGLPRPQPFVPANPTIYEYAAFIRLPGSGWLVRILPWSSYIEG